MGETAPRCSECNGYGFDDGACPTCGITQEEL